jgi:hypothetical protein
MLKFLRKAKLYIFAIPLLLWAFGAGLNQIAINANHDSMPIVFNASNFKDFIDVKNGYPVFAQGEIFTDSQHSIMNPNSRFKILCDWIDFVDVKYSIGDVILFAGEDLGKVIPYVWGLALFAELRKKEE